MSVKKYKFGSPIETEAVVEDIPLTPGAPGVGTVELGEHFRMEIPLPPGTAVYGLGEALGGIDKRGGFYVSYNVDEDYHRDGADRLYGSHNFLLLGFPAPVGLFFDSPGRVEFDVGFTREDTLAVTALYPDLYLYVLEGESLLDVTREFRRIIGRSWIPPKWAMGFGQSRFGYVTREDFLEVARGYRESGIPLDSIYMDIDYMEGYRDFTVDGERIPDFPGFVSEMRELGIHLVPIIDAAVKRDEGYSLCDEGLRGGYFCTGEDGEPFETASWPGVTYLPDFLNPEVRRWFGDKYKYLIESGVSGFWNDMNEPAVFYTREGMEGLRRVMEKFLGGGGDGMEIFSLFEALGGLGGAASYPLFYHNMGGRRVNHDRVHNLYGFNMLRAASESFERLAPGRRLLIFSRSSYIGAHRYGGIWTGDNNSRWEDLELNIRMMPSLNMCGFLFSGADIGGFRENASRELLLRWLAFGVFTPLMRDHTASGTRRQECYAFGDTSDFAHVIGVRYALLPYLYSELVKAALSGDMYFRPLAFDYPSDPLAREREDQLMLGEGLMVTPVHRPNVTGRNVYLPEDMLFIKFTPSGLYRETMGRGWHYIDVLPNEVPLFLRQNCLLPIAKPAQSVAEIDENDLQIVAWLTRPADYTMYRDDGETRDIMRPEHFITLHSEP